MAYLGLQTKEETVNPLDEGNWPSLTMTNQGIAVLTSQRSFDSPCLTDRVGIGPCHFKISFRKNITEMKTLKWMCETVSLIWEQATAVIIVPQWGAPHWPNEHISQQPTAGHLPLGLSIFVPLSRLAQIAKLQSITLRWHPSTSSHDAQLKHVLVLFTKSVRK